MRRFLFFACSIFLFSHCSPNNLTKTKSGQSLNEDSSSSGSGGSSQFLTGKGSIPSTFMTEDGPKEWVGKKVVYGKTTDSLGNKAQLSGAFLRPGGSIRSGPAILAIHGRAGLNSDLQNTLLGFVAAGYLVFAIDMYGQVPKTWDEGVAIENALVTRGESNILSLIQQGRQNLTDKLGGRRVALVGFDTGGKWALMASIDGGDKFQACVSYYGNPLQLKQSKSQIKVPFWGVFSGTDQEIPKADLTNLSQMFTGFYTEVHFTIFDDVQPGFMEPIRESAFNKEKTKVAIDETLVFLRKYLIELQ